MPRTAGKKNKGQGNQMSGVAQQTSLLERERYSLNIKDRIAEQGAWLPN